MAKMEESYMLADMNFEINLFINKLNIISARKISNREFYEQLLKLLNNIENLIHSNGVNVNSLSKAYWELNLKENCVSRYFYCNACKMDLGISAGRLKDHCCKLSHQKATLNGNTNKLVNNIKGSVEKLPGNNIDKNPIRERITMPSSSVISEKNYVDCSIQKQSNSTNNEKNSKPGNLENYPGFLESGKTKNVETNFRQKSEPVVVQNNTAVITDQNCKSDDKFKNENLLKNNARLKNEAILKNNHKSKDGAKLGNKEESKSEKLLKNNEKLKNNDSFLKGKDFKKDDIVLPEKMNVLLLGNIPEQLCKALDRANSVKELQSFQEIHESLRTILVPKFPNVGIHFYGSRVNGLGDYDDDFDIFIEIDFSYKMFQESTKKILTSLNATENILKDNKKDWKIVAVIRDASVPIIRCSHIKMNVQCDLSFTNGLGKCNTLLLKYLFEMQPTCNKICIYFKRWLKSSCIGIILPTYCFMLMIIFYFQHIKALPAIKTLQENIMPICIGPWQTNFRPSSLNDLNIEKLSDDDEKILKLIRDIMEFYSIFPFNNYIISTYMGCQISKDKINTDSNLCPRYYKYYKESTGNNSIHLDRPICVQDPIVLNRNVGKSLTKSALHTLQKYFILSMKQIDMKLEKFN